MNICILSGRVQRNAIVKGTEPKTLSFILEISYGNNESEKKSNYLPCVLFNPTAEVEALLTTQGEGLQVELEGRLSGSNPEINNGRKFGTEVIVRNRSLNILQSGE